MSAQVRVRRGFNRLAVSVAGIAFVVAAAALLKAGHEWWIAPDMPDVAKIERNVTRMINGNAPPWDIYAYLKTETTLPDGFKLENLGPTLIKQAADRRWLRTKEPLFLGVALMVCGALAAGLVSLLGWILAGFF